MKARKKGRRAKVVRRAKAGDKAFVEKWQQAGPELQRVRDEELRAYDHQEKMWIVDSMLRIACARAVPRTTSGLVEMQRLFAKARK